MDVRPTWTDCDEARDYVVPNVLSPRDLVSRPDNMDERTCFLESSNGIMLSREHKQKNVLIMLCGCLLISGIAESKFAHNEAHLILY